METRRKVKMKIWATVIGYAMIDDRDDTIGDIQDIEDIQDIDDAELIDIIN